MILRIRQWDKYFENAASRKLKRLDWVAIPNKMDGEGYTALVDHPDAAAHLGAWYAIVEVASKQEPRGNLPGGIPQGIGGICRSLSRISRLPQSIFRDVIPRLLEIGWIEQVLSDCEVADTLGESASEVAESADKVAAQGRELQGTTGKGTTTTSNGANGAATPPMSPPPTHHEYPLTLAEIREHDAAADAFFCIRLADEVARAIVGHPTASKWPPERARQAVSDETLRRACRESYLTPGRKERHGTGLLLKTVPNIVCGGKVNYA